MNLRTRIFTCILGLAVALPASAGYVLKKPVQGLKASDAAGVLNVSPSSLDFGNLAPGQNSAPREVALTNPTLIPVKFSGGVTASENFTVSHNCPSELGYGQSCIASVMFAPKTAGNLGNYLGFANSSRGEYRIFMAGTGVGSILQVSGNSMSFANSSVGVTSTRALTITNQGTAPLLISSIATTEPFEANHDCGTLVSPGSACNIVVSVTPGSISSLTGSLTITSDAVGTPSKVIAITGNSVITDFATSTSALNFGSLPLNTEAELGILVTNVSENSLTLSNVSTSGMFSATHNCQTVTAGSNCQINVKYSPTTLHGHSGSLSITSSNGGNRSIALTGTGQGSSLVASPNPLNFGLVALAIPTLKEITLQNVGNSAATLVGLSTDSPQFVTGSNCPASLQGGASCQISVSFTPLLPYQTTATLSVLSDALNQNMSVSLLGTGAGASLGVSTNTLNFGPVALQEPSVMAVELINDGSSDLTISSITSAGVAYGSQHNCGVTLVPGGTCIINMTFNPVTFGSHGGSLTIQSNSLGGTKVINLTGIGLGAMASTGTASISFGKTGVGVPVVKQLTVNNTGTANLVISAVTKLSPAVTLDSTGCTAPVLPGQFCTVTATFNPTEHNAYSDIVSVVSNSMGGDLNFNLTGEGSGALIDLGTTSLNFGAIPVNTSQPMTLAVTNPGSADLTISGLNFSGMFSGTHNCNAVPGGQTCQININYLPTAVGDHSQLLTITSNAFGVAPVVSLTGTGQGPVLGLNGTTSVNFGAVSVSQGVPGSAFVTAINNGNIPLQITNVATEAPFATSLPACATSIIPGASCNIPVSFMPTGVVASSEALTITTNAGVQSVSLYGTGSGANATVSTSSLDFGNRAVGTSDTKAVELTNTGDAPFTITGVFVTGAGISANHNCNAVAGGGTCFVNVSYSPTAIGTLNASAKVTFASNSTAALPEVRLYGTGTGIEYSVDKTSLAFGTVVLNQVASGTVVIQNTGNLQGNPSLDISGEGMSKGSCTVLNPGQSCTVTLEFRPTVAGAVSGSFTVSGGLSGAKLVNLTGTGSSAQMFSVNSNMTNANIASIMGNPSSVINAIVTIQPGVIIYSNSTGTPALVSGSVPAGSSVTLINKGTIVGAGGNGGYGGYIGIKEPALAGGVGGAGGTALHITSTTVNVINEGYILGGGGGGGGGGMAGGADWTYGPGGGGGAGMLGGGVGSNYTAIGAGSCTSGSAGGSTGGAGIICTAVSSVATAGNGGNYGLAGTSGLAGACSDCGSPSAGGAGGTGGPAIQWNGTGVRLSGNTSSPYIQGVSQP